jgi:sugar O-acyltransferase (sialic acid O-acetyltransferase NeuD family)
MNKSLFIFGAGGHGKVIADLSERIGYNVFFYDDSYPEKNNNEHWPIIGSFFDLLALDPSLYDLAVAIGDNVIRENKVMLLLKKGFHLPVLTDSTAMVSKYAEIGSGSVIFAGAVVNAFSKIGTGCIVNTCAVIDHDTVVGDFSHICPNVTLAGDVNIGNNCWIGIGSQVKEQLTIGENSLIGAGSTVLGDLPNDVMAYGSPAKIVRNRD